MDNRTTFEFILFAGLIASIKIGQRETTASKLLKAGFSSCAYNQAAYLNHLYQNRIITIEERYQSDKDDDYIDLNDDYRITSYYPNDDLSLKELINKIQATDIDEKQDAILEIIREELIGEVFYFLAEKIISLDIGMDVLAEPPSIITELLKDFSVLEVCGCIESAVNKFNQNKLRILKCTSDDDAIVTTICNTIDRQDMYHFTDRPTKTSNLMYLLTEHLTEIGPDYWKNERLWSELELQDIDTKLVNLTFSESE